jgi:sulfoxide reductase catalytic subunit YedY
MRADVEGTLRRIHVLGRPEAMPGTRAPVLSWPYVEGLRLDEAMHPLTILVVGLYGEILPNQNGAPLRLAVMEVRLQARQIHRQDPFRGATAAEHVAEAGTTGVWLLRQRDPTVDHPRWSQATERRLPGFFKNHKTLMFNGYGDEVASLYSGMDLKKNF